VCDTSLGMSWDQLRQMIQRVSERTQEIRYGIKTSGWTSEEALGYQKGDGRNHYTPLPYAAIKRLLSTVIPDKQKDVFVDWGSGLGRVVVLASTYSYREVIGVEFSPSLCVAAKSNLDRARIKQRCGSVRIVNMDAREFPVPADSTVMFFFNPFRGQLLTQVVKQIRDSWIDHPRSITFLVSNHADFIADTGSTDWLSPVSVWSTYPHISCSVIRTRD
jgi:tRNA/tmRNA/rRNA uracil-C5-methylase (TrmA/RlmC/RlmD family)